MPTNALGRLSLITPRSQDTTEGKRAFLWFGRYEVRYLHSWGARELAIFSQSGYDDQTSTQYKQGAAGEQML